MRGPVTALAVDLGSSSGRVVAGTYDGARITLREAHRFAHGARPIDGALVWDRERLVRESIAGLRSAVAHAPNPVSVSVDTWGVDVVLLDSAGAEVGPAWAYRDERTARTHAAFRQRVSDEASWATSGIQPATINTANQLFALLQEAPEVAADTSRVLWWPDYMAYVLSGRMGWSRSICSSSALATPGARRWNTDMMGALGIDPTWFGPLDDELAVTGPARVDGLESLQVVKGGAHDTACAVHAVSVSSDSPGAVGDSYFLSCGSWSVLGTERSHALLDGRVRHAGLTNEVRTDGGIRLLHNLTGLWILQECQREWAAAGQLADSAALVSLAAAEPSLGITIDPDDPVFTAPGAMIARVSQRVYRGGGPNVLRPGQTVRVILESLAARYARGVATLAAVTGTSAAQLRLVGGGAHNALLCQLTADAVGVPVIAGPAEASALGSVVAQLETLGVLDPRDRAAVVEASSATRCYRPGMSVLGVR